MRLDPGALPARLGLNGWPQIGAAITTAFVAHDRYHWAEVFKDSDACVTPVLSFGEVETEPHIAERGTFFATETTSSNRHPRRGSPDPTADADSTA